MTTIAVVRKNGVAAIAADSLTKWGSAKESATYIANHEKILQVGDSQIAITGSATFKLILRDYFSGGGEVRLSSAADIFRTWNRLHVALKERYFVLPEEDKEDALESSRLDVLIANPYGIFGVSGHRTVQEFSRFYAYGTGSDYALGALYSAYDEPARSAEALARHAIEAAAEFDDCTGLPLTCTTVRLLQA
ncbi:MAG TPA: MFS transporter [Burkholderiales bacterium]|jgi:ATP-dependent protease HslVU (ClpYQ) peptidase subunit